MSNRARLRGGTSSRTRANAKTERLESARERVEGNDEGEGAHRPTDADALLCLFLCERRRPGHDAIVSTWTRRETRAAKRGKGIRRWNRNSKPSFDGSTDGDWSARDSLKSTSMIFFPKTRKAAVAAGGCNRALTSGAHTSRRGLTSSSAFGKDGDGVLGRSHPPG